eukprot:6214135-Pleurochrysis_carterae.AAC.1
MSEEKKQIVSFEWECIQHAFFGQHNFCRTPDKDYCTHALSRAISHLSKEAAISEEQALAVLKTYAMHEKEPVSLLSSSNLSTHIKAEEMKKYNLVVAQISGADRKYEESKAAYDVAQTRNKIYKKLSSALLRTTNL